LARGGTCDSTLPILVVFGAVLGVKDVPGSLSYRSVRSTFGKVLSDNLHFLSVNEAAHQVLNRDCGQMLSRHGPPPGFLHNFLHKRQTAKWLTRW
jgi:hypothetical protein